MGRGLTQQQQQWLFTPKTRSIEEAYIHEQTHILEYKECRQYILIGILLFDRVMGGLLIWIMN